MTLKTALVVDDSKSARKMLQKLLTKKSLETEAVETGEDAIEYLQGLDRFPDVIFMDHMMPGMNGLETSKKITDNPATDSIPIVMFTSKEDPDYIDLARSHGASAILRKPLSPSELDEVIDYISNLNDQAMDSSVNTHEEEEQDMPTAMQVPEMNYEEIEDLARMSAETAAREAVSSQLPDALAQQFPALKKDILAALPVAEDTSDMRETLRNLQDELETLQGRMAAVTETMQAHHSEDILNDEVRQQIVSTAETSAAEVSSSMAETVAARIAEEVAMTTAREYQASQAGDFVKLTETEYRRLKFMASAGLMAAIVALAVAVF